MKTFLDVLVVWIALDVVLIASWHLAHVRSRRLGARALAAVPATPRAFTVTPEARVGEPQPALVLAGSG